MEKMPAALLLSFMLLVLELRFYDAAKNTTFGGCIPHERKALLKLRASFVDPSNRLSSWEDHTDCCIWEGVRCNNISGHVIKLDLGDCGNDPLDYYNATTALQSKSLDSSLLELKHLNYLDLSCNDFQFSKIPAFLGSVKQLQYLNLSNAFFSGIIPHQLGNLSSLHTLDLNRRDSYIKLIVVDPTWISNLSSLEYLDLTYVDLSQTTYLVELFNTLPSLITLRLSESALNNSHISHACINVTILSHVQQLDLSGNSFYGEFPCFLHNMTSLRFLDLSYNSGYNSSDPHFLSSINLVDLNLGGNRLQHNANWISEFLWDRCSLKSLDLSDNGFHGNISDAFKNMSGCWTSNLERLSLGSNNFYGHLPKELGEMRQLIYVSLPSSNISGPIPTFVENLSALEVLDISYNAFSGPIPSFLGNLRALRVLNLYSNYLSGEIPVSLGQLSNLESIGLFQNWFNQTLLEAHFAKLSKLESLIASNIKFDVGCDWVPPFQLKSLYLRDSNIGGQFPPWLLTQKALIELYLSNCSIAGILPKGLGGRNLQVLDLSKNSVYGTVPELSSNIYSLDLSDNMINNLPNNIGHMLPLVSYLVLVRNSINGSLPISLCNMKDLAYLDLSQNHLSGHLFHCWQSFRQLRFVSFSSNELSGIIPKSIGGAYLLRWLRLDKNHLRGQLPSTLRNCTDLEVLDVGKNKLSGKIPEWIGNYLLRLRILRLRNNQFQGVIPRALCQESLLQIVDLGINNLTGYIPDCFLNFSGMGVPTLGDVLYITFSEYYMLDQVLKGAEMEYTSTLKYLANLDLSCNNLVGGIPSELIALDGLRGLNPSYNHLHGEIPRMIGRMNKLESLDLSNNHLFGRIPESLSDNTFLTKLNLSNNNLSGQIPTGRQLQTLEDGPSIYGGNPLLCGAPLPKKCPGKETQKRTNAEKDAGVGDEDTVDKIWLYAFVIGGYATGLWGFIGVLVLKRRWRYAYFGYIEAAYRKMVGR